MLDLGLHLLLLPHKRMSDSECERERAKSSERAKSRERERMVLAWRLNESVSLI
jgi:hypothetical protein